MFSLVITLISIALVAALALATLYYGGAIFNDGAERALVSRIEAQAQQLMGALDLYKADTGAYPATLDLLVSSNYLKSLPAALESTQNTLSSAYAATSTWTLAGPYAPVTVLTPVSEATCKAFNKVKYGQAGVLKALRMQLGQCFGTDVNNLMIVTAKSTADLVAVAADPAAAIQLGAVLPDAVPDAASMDSSSAGWLVPPVGLASTASAALLYFDDNTGAAISSLVVPSTVVGSVRWGAVDVKNNGAVSVTLASPGFIASPPFTVSYSECDGVTLAPGGMCYLEVEFRPTVAQTYTGPSYALSPQGIGATLPNLPVSGVATGVPAVPTLVVEITARVEPDLVTNPAALYLTFNSKNGADLSAINPAPFDVLSLSASGGFTPEFTGTQYYPGQFRDVRGSCYLNGSVGPDGYALPVLCSAQPAGSYTVTFPATYDYTWSAYAVTASMAGTGSSVALPSSNDPAFALTSLNGVQGFKLIGSQPYNVGNTFSLELPATLGGANPTWCATFPADGPYPRVGHATAGPC